MDFANVVLTWYSKIFRLYDSPVDMFSPVLSHLFFIYDAEEFCNELRIDGDELKKLVPNGKNLISHYLDILLNELSNSVGISIAHLESSLYWSLEGLAKLFLRAQAIP